MTKQTKQIKYSKYYPKYQYVLYDARARATGDTDEAVVLETSTKKPTKVPEYYGDGSIWARLEKLDNDKIPTYGNEKLLWEIS